MIDRVQKVIQFKKLSASGFADLVGVPRSTISHILSGRNNPSLEFLQKVLDVFPEIRTEWLVRGKGNMLETGSSLFPDKIPVSRDQSVPSVAFPKEGERARKEISPAGIATIPFPEYNKTVSGLESAGKTPPGKDFLTDKASGNVPENTEDPAKTMRKGAQAHKDLYRVLFFYTDGTFSEFCPGIPN